MLFENEIDNDIVEDTFNYILQSETEELPENNRWINSHTRAWKVNRIRGELRRGAMRFCGMSPKMGDR